MVMFFKSKYFFIKLSSTLFITALHYFKSNVQSFSNPYIANSSYREHASKIAWLSVSTLFEKNLWISGYKLFDGLSAVSTMRGINLVEVMAYQLNFIYV